MNESYSSKIIIPDSARGKRLDATLASLLPDYSRGVLQKWIAAGAVLVNGKLASKRQLLVGGEQVVINATLPKAEHWQAQDLPLVVVAEDADYLVINKPAGLVVHPAAGNRDRTLVNALLHNYPELAALPRAGIVHRLDKDTSGLMVVARTLPAHASLVRQLQARTVNRTYQAIVNGVLIAGGIVDQPIGRHHVARKKMAVVGNGKQAITHYRVLKRFARHTHLEVKLATGRTHQIRVHMTHLGYPLVGDKTYGGRVVLPPKPTAQLAELLQHFPRQALHASELAFISPTSGEQVKFQIPLPDDMAELLQLLAE